tara:strand:- start:223 stop:603 length:381 start_codon:yes stop_codon:yes gene_type:complete
MPANGQFSRIAKQKYGYRPDDRRSGLMQLFDTMIPVVTEKIRFVSDQHPYYKSILRDYYPNALYKQIKGSKRYVAGQDELQKRGKDLLFYINYTLAMCRTNIKSPDAKILVYHQRFGAISISFSDL